LGASTLGETSDESHDADLDSVAATEGESGGDGWA